MAGPRAHRDAAAALSAAVPGARSRPWPV